MSLPAPFCATCCSPFQVASNYWRNAIKKTQTCERIRVRFTKEAGPTSVTTSAARVKTTPQMTRFRDSKVCNNWLQIRIDDHRIQSDYKCKSELQNPEGKKSVLGIASAW